MELGTQARLGGKSERVGAKNAFGVSLIPILLTSGARFRFLVLPMGGYSKGEQRGFESFDTSEARRAETAMLSI